MSSVFRSALFALSIVLAGTAGARELRVCADPDNLPMSDEHGGGFENRIARLLADELGAELRYEWWPLQRGFVRKTAGLCEVFIGVPKDFERVLTTRPYYRSSYVFVDAPAASGVRRFDDPRLRTLRVGVQLVGNDLAATPPGHALARAGHVDNVRGFTPYGEGPASVRMIDALARGELDVALIWGPQAGDLAAHAAKPLEVRIATPPAGLEGMPFEFDIAIGVRRGGTALRDELDAAIAKRRGDIDAILAAYAVPRTDAPAGPVGAR